MNMKKPACACFAVLAPLGFDICVAEEVLAPMVVTAARLEQSTLEAPTNMSVVTKDDLEAIS